MSETAPRVRFAPAPTGFLHVGSARSALFNWLYARHHGGKFVLRIEDTNLALATPEFYSAITKPLEWLGIDWDEGPFLQSERTELYLEAIRSLVDSGSCYFCDCTREEIAERNTVTGFKGGYDGHCRNRENVIDGEGTVVRFATPETGVTVVDDLVRGRVSFANVEFEDFIVRRGNGTPVFLVANTVDDADMGITMVVRGEDLLNSTPKILLLWDALGYGQPPTYAHLPLLIGNDRKKLSKRKDSVALADFEAQGFLPEALVNYLALLGWGPPDDVEVRPMSEIIELFDLGSVNKAPAFFDIKKLEHINSEYIRALPVLEFLDRLKPWLGEGAPWPKAQFSEDVLFTIAPHIQERLRRLSDIGPLVDWLFTDKAPVETDAKEVAKIEKLMARSEVPAVLEATIVALAASDWTSDALDTAVMTVGEELGVKSQVPVRIAVTGRRVGLPLFESMALVSRQSILDRLESARAGLE